MGGTGTAQRKKINPVQIRLQFDQTPGMRTTDQFSITVDPANDPQFQKAWRGRTNLLRQRRAMEIVNLHRF